jgi:hypothetical protein
MDTGLSFGSFIPSIIVTLLIIAGMWGAFSKAGQPGWAAIIPFYNIYVWLKVAGRPGWWLVLMLIPVVNFIVGILVAISVAARFGLGTGFGLGLAFLPMVSCPILGFGNAQYKGNAA